MLVLLFQLCLLQNAVQCAGRQIVSWMAGNSHPPQLGCMLILPMAAFCCNQIPSIGLNAFYDITYFHNETI